MATNVTPFPRLPTPGQQIDTQYMTDLVRALEIFLSRHKTHSLTFQRFQLMETAIFFNKVIYIADGGF